MEIQAIFKDFKRIYGRQGWWPLCLISYPEKNNFSNLRNLRLENGLIYGIPWKAMHRFETKEYDPFFDIAVGAILTQNTAWKNVSKALQNLANNRLLTPKSILSLKTITLEKYLRPSGYYKQKAKKLKLLADYIQKKYKGKTCLIFKQNLRKAREELLNIWGIGQETADSILLYAGSQPIFVIDTYTKRLCLQYGLSFKTYQEYQTFFMKNFTISNTVKKIDSYKEFHALIVCWGKNHKNYSHVA